MSDILPVGRIFRNHPEHRRAHHDVRFENGAAWVIDELLPVDTAAVPITDLGFMRADAVYDVVTVSRGSFFRLDQHQLRFERSCARMRLTNPYDRSAMSDILHDIVAASGFRDAYVFWCVTRGANPQNTDDRLQPGKFSNRFYAFAIPYVFIKPDADRIAGINVWVSCDYVRIPPGAVDPRAKNFCSLDLAMSLFEAGDQGADWSVLTDGQGNLTESPGSNVFVIRNGEVSTPDLGCLEGITRQTVLELCRELHIPARDQRVSVEELRQADEAFITSSAGGVIPVTSVGGRAISNGPGPITTRLHNLYWEKRWAGWHGKSVNYPG